MRLGAVVGNYAFRRMPDDRNDVIRKWRLRVSFRPVGHQQEAKPAREESKTRFDAGLSCAKTHRGPR